MFPNYFPSLLKPSYLKHWRMCHLEESFAAKLSDGTTVPWKRTYFAYATPGGNGGGAPGFFFRGKRSVGANFRRTSHSGTSAEIRKIGTSTCDVPQGRTPSRLPVSGSISDLIIVFFAVFSCSHYSNRVV